MRDTCVFFFKVLNFKLQFILYYFWTVAEKYISLTYVGFLDFPPLNILFFPLRIILDITSR